MKGYGDMPHDETPEFFRGDALEDENSQRAEPVGATSASDVGQLGTWQRLRKLWASRGVAVNPGATDEEIRDAERRLGIRLTAELREYFATMNGIQGADELGLWFYSLHELEDLETAYGTVTGCPVGARWLLFGDYMLRVHLYAVQVPRHALAQTGPVFYINSDHVQIAPSLREFFEDYLGEPVKVAFPMEQG
jgi:hypothetical protein